MYSDTYHIQSNDYDPQSRASNVAVATKYISHYKGEVDVGGQRDANIDYRVLVGPNSPYDEEISEANFDSDSSSSSTSSDLSVNDSSVNEIDTIQYTSTNSRGTPLKEKLPVSPSTSKTKALFASQKSGSSRSFPAQDFVQLTQSSLAAHKRGDLGLVYSSPNTPERTQGSPQGKLNLDATSSIKKYDNYPIGTIIAFNGDASSNGGLKVDSIKQPISGVNYRTLLPPSASSSVPYNKNKTHPAICKDGGGNRNKVSSKQAATSSTRVAEKNVERMLVSQSNKDIVSRMINDVVKQADKFRRLQTSLGLVDANSNSKSNAIFFPGSNPSLLMKKKAYFVPSFSIQKAFLLADLPLSESQVSILYNLVHDFAFSREGNVQYNNKSKDDVDFDLCMSPVLQKGKINVYWLQSYLMNLRRAYLGSSEIRQSPLKSALKSPSSRLLKTFAVSVNNFTGNGTQDALLLSHLPSNLIDSVRATEKIDAAKSKSQVSRTSKKAKRRNGKGNSDSKKGIKSSSKKRSSNVHFYNADEVELQDWDSWYSGFYINGDMKIADPRPREFKKAMSGRPYALKPSDLAEFLREFRIISHDLFLEEVKYLVDAWVYDLEDTNEFQDEVVTLITKWEQAGNFLLEDFEPRTRKKVFETVKNKVIIEENALLLMEEAAIGTKLFLKYDQFCRDTRQRNPDADLPPWRQWHRLHLDNRVNDLYLYRETLTNLRFVSKRRVNTPKAIVSPPPKVQKTRSRSSGGKKRNNRHSIPSSPSSIPNAVYSDEGLYKNLINLQKASLGDPKGQDNRHLISQTKFDYFIHKVIAPVVKKNKSKVNRVNKVQTRRKEEKGAPGSEYSDRDVGVSTTDGTTDGVLNLNLNDSDFVFNRTKKSKSNVDVRFDSLMSSDYVKYRSLSSEGQNYYDYDRDVECNAWDKDRRISYEEWLVRASEEERLRAHEKAKKEQAIKKAHEERSLMGKQSYREWLDLRAQKKYRSSLGHHKVKVSLPTDKVVSHAKSWDGSFK